MKKIPIKKGVQKVKSTVKKSAKESLDVKLQEAIEKYNVAHAELEHAGTSLFIQREKSVDILEYVEDLVNSIANRPKDFDTEISEIHLSKKKFKEGCEFAKEELEAAKKSAVGVGAGVASGMAVASLAPTGAMWIATTFGTASTGTAISTLSGIAAQNAALAWLGGGTLAMGGGGTAAGTAFLALAGPIGWGIAGATLLASIGLFANKKIKLSKEKKDEIKAVLKNAEQVKEYGIKIGTILEKTSTIKNALSEQYKACIPFFGKDFLSLPDEAQFMLGSLVNNAKALSVMLETEIEE